MSDTKFQLELESLMKLSEADSLQLLKTKIPVLKCIMCSNVEFNLMGDALKNEFTIDVGYSLPDGSPIGFRPALTVACKNCGFLHKFDFGSLVSINSGDKSN